MSRYAGSYEGELRSEKVTVQLTPSERALLEAGAAETGVTLSQHVRELCLYRRSVAAQIGAGTRRNPKAAALMTQLSAIGNNLNQLSRHCNTEKTAPQLAELKRSTDMFMAAIEGVLDGKIS